jgi:UDPglucose 6-dehydrogenase
MKVSVVGTGYVGLVTGVCFADVGHDVICVDVDRAKVDRINRGETPIYEKGLAELLQQHVGQRLSASTSLAQAVDATEVTFIAVGTPFDGQRIDLSFVRRAATEIGAALRGKHRYHTVVVKSTVVPGTTDEVVGPAVSEASNKRVGEDFGLGMNPEFLTEGVAIDDFMRPDRIVIGGVDARTVDTLARLYEPFSGVPILRTDNKTAEMIKYVSNSVLATLVSFSNEIGNLCARLGGIDMAEVMRGVHLARYFSLPTPQGGRAAAPITSFLYAGCGFGGSCLPKDVSALAAHGRAAGEAMPLLETVLQINARQPFRMIAMLESQLASLSGMRIGVLGVAFKPDTDDIRESPSLPVIRELIGRGAKVSLYDPAAMESARVALVDQPITFCDSMEAVVQDADAVLVMTAWDEFRTIDRVIARSAKSPLVVDGRRILDRSRIPRYAGIGWRE